MAPVQRGTGSRVTPRQRFAPTRPTRPLSGFNLFIKDYFQTDEARSCHTASEVLAQAGMYWRSHPAEQQAYAEQARPGLLDYKRQVRGFAKKKKILNKPGNAYIQFLQHLWRTEANGRSVAEMGQVAGQRWRAMSRDEKERFRREAHRARIGHARMIEEVSLGRAQLDDYITDGEE